MSKNLTLQYNSVVYQIQTGRPTYALRRAQVEVRERWDGRLAINYSGKPLAHTVYREPPQHHPWRKFHYGKDSHHLANGTGG